MEITDFNDLLPVQFSRP